MNPHVRTKILFFGKIFVAKVTAEAPWFMLSHFVLEKYVPLLETGTTLAANVTSNAVDLLKIEI